MHWHHNLNPFILGPWHLGYFDNFGIRWYSLPYIFGFVGVWLALHKAVVARRIPNGDLDRLDESSLLLITSIIVGGRFGYFLLNRTRDLATWDGWKELPKVWHGGMAFFGAVVMVFCTEYFYCKKHRLGFWHGADRIMWVFAMALGFGRIANFINGELYGIPTNQHWGVMFPNVAATDLINGQNVYRHPVQLYSAVTHWMLAFFLLYLLRRKPRTKFDRVPGFTCFWFLGGYGLLRFLTDFWRQETIWVIPHYLNGGQGLSLLLLIAGIVCAQVRYRALVKYGQPWDWYPEEGVTGELPPECNAFLDAKAADASEAAIALAKKVEKATSPAEQPKPKARPKAKRKR
jgi:phosphatidylglycerol:prolipoprotein diacylglycerol transferase